MRGILFLVLLLGSITVRAQIITTIAGTGVASNTGDNGPATAAAIDYPCGGVFDKFGNYYFGLGSVGCSVRKISPSGIITTVAGNGSCGYGGDNGPATAAMLKNVQAVTVDTVGNIYIADADNTNRIRKVSIATGIITTIAGTGVGGYNGDGIPATNAKIYNPLDLCFDKVGNLYFADHANSRVRKIDAAGIITTVAGNGIPGYGSTNVPATSVSIGQSGICFDQAGNLYIADWHARVYKVNTLGIISYYAGNGTGSFSGDNGSATAASTIPYKIVMDRYGNLFIAEYDQERIRMVNSLGIITTIAGNGISAYGGDGGMASMAQFNHPAGLALDSCDNIYIADSRTWRIRKITYPKCHYLDVIEHSIPLNISIHPNPATDLLQIDNIPTPTNYRLLNLVGSSVQQGILKHGSNSISVRSLPAGMYLLEVMDEDGRRVVRKVIKE